MKIIRDLHQVCLTNTIVTMGKFDGFHIGHRLLLDTAVRLKQAGMQAVIFTFRMHPGRLLERENGSEGSRKTIQTIEEREAGEYPEGIDYLIEYPFDRETMAMEPEQFVREVLVKQLGVRMIVAGDDFRFGKQRSGNVHTLEELGKTYGFRTVILEKVRIRLPEQEDLQEVSSTLVKEEIRAGRMENVRLLLGRPFSVTGPVLHGKHLGTSLGFPTLNLAVPETKIMPPDGVYVTDTLVQGHVYHGITNAGVRPTFDDGEQRTVETFLFDFNREIYGMEVTVQFLHFLRPEQKFSGPQELMAQLGQDEMAARSYFMPRSLLQ